MFFSRFDHCRKCRWAVCSQESDLSEQACTKRQQVKEESSAHGQAFLQYDKPSICQSEISDKHAQSLQTGSKITLLAVNDYQHTVCPRDTYTGHLRSVEQQQAS